MKSKGTFIDFFLAYKLDGVLVSDLDQATKILEHAESLLEKGSQGVAITYSANYGQTLKIEETYQSGGWNTETNGSNQAAVIAAMESLLGDAFESLRKKVRIAPITTMTYSGYGGKTHKEVVKEDLDRIQASLDAGWDILAWINQDSQPEYAIGGGVAKGLDENGNVRFPPELAKLVQKSLAEFSKDYPEK